MAKPKKSKAQSTPMAFMSYVRAENARGAWDIDEDCLPNVKRANKSRVT